MPAPLEVRDFASDDLDAASELLAARHRRDRARFPLLPERFEDAGACLEILRSAMGYAEGVAAHRDGRLAGFLFAVDNLPAPTSGTARFAPDRGTMMLGHTHAVAPDSEPGEVYRALYAVLAERWVQRGIFDHTAHIPAGDPPTEEAWVNLAFGRWTAFAIRDLRPVERPPRASVEVRRAGPEDLDAVYRLQLEEARFHARAPIFRPYLERQTRAEVREATRAGLEVEGQAKFIARLDGRDVGTIEVEPHPFSPLFTPDGAVGIGDTAVIEDARGAGVGAALTDAAIAWARERDYRAVHLHFATPNPLSVPFWTGLGFVPVMWHMRRRLDERIAWARP